MPFTGASTAVMQLMQLSLTPRREVALIRLAVTCLMAAVLGVVGVVVALAAG